MWKIFSLLLIICSPAILNTQAKPLIFTHVTVIDMVDARLKPDMTVVVEGNRITAIVKSSRIRPPANAHVIDATGKFLIPGLWDMHVHALRRERVDHSFKLFVVNGVTGIRDMGTTEEGFASLDRLRKEIANETRIGPRIIAAGRILDGAKPAVPENSIPLSNETEAREAVRFLKRNGADFIKVYDRVGRDGYFAIADEAKKQNIPFAGHVPPELTSSEASDAGQRSFEHLATILRDCSTLDAAAIEARVNASIKPSIKPNDYSGIPARIAARTKIELETYNKQKCVKLFSRFVKNETWQVPTLTAKQSFALADTGIFSNDRRTKYVSLAERERWKPENNLFFKYRTT